MGPGAITFALQLLAQLPGLIAAGAQVVELVNQTRERLEDMQANNREPTAQEWEELNQRIDSLRQQLHSP